MRLIYATKTTWDALSLTTRGLPLVNFHFDWSPPQHQLLGACSRLPGGRALNCAPLERELDMGRLGTAPGALLLALLVLAGSHSFLVEVRQRAGSAALQILHSGAAALLPPLPPESTLQACCFVHASSSVAAPRNLTGR